MHAALPVTRGHLLVQDAAAGCHPLHVAGGHFAFVAQAVTVLDRAGQHVGDRFDSTVRMPRKAGTIVLRFVAAKVVQ